MFVSGPLQKSAWFVRNLMLSRVTIGFEYPCSPYDFQEARLHMQTLFPFLPQALMA